MELENDLKETVSEILGGSWDEADGRVVPEPEDIGLTGNDGVKLAAVMLYADLADSTALVVHNRRIAAEVFKAFLYCASKIILARGGYVRSFDGDRVMGVFLGDFKHTNAAKAALQINWAVLKIIRPNFEEQYEVFRNGTLKIVHCTGVDSSNILVARAGGRGNNDLIWVGPAANVAAKLSTIRQDHYHSWITKRVYDAMKDSAKIASDGTTNYWKSSNWTALPVGARDLYRSSWWVKTFS